MIAKRSVLVALFCLLALTLTGCVFFHHRHCRCSTPCETSALEKPCPQTDGCAKAGGGKPCAVKVPAAENPAVPAK